MTIETTPQPQIDSDSQRERLLDILKSEIHERDESLAMTVHAIIQLADRGVISVQHRDQLIRQLIGALVEQQFSRPISTLVHEWAHELMHNLDDLCSPRELGHSRTRFKRKKRTLSKGKLPVVGRMHGRSLSPNTNLNWTPWFASGSPKERK